MAVNNDKHQQYQQKHTHTHTTSCIANCNNGMKINAPMRMRSERQKVTNWQAFCTFFFVLFRHVSIWMIAKMRKKKKHMTTKPTQLEKNYINRIRGNVFLALNSKGEKELYFV